MASRQAGRGSSFRVGDQPQLQRYLGESGALLVLGKVFDAELVKERAQVGLHGVQAQDQLIRDLLVARRAGVGTRVLVWPAQCDQDRSLGLGQTGDRGQYAACNRLRAIGLRQGAERQDRLTDPDLVAVTQPR